MHCPLINRPPLMSSPTCFWYELVTLVMHSSILGIQAQFMAIAPSHYEKYCTHLTFKITFQVVQGTLQCLISNVPNGRWTIMNKQHVSTDLMAFTSQPGHTPQQQPGAQFNLPIFQPCPTGHWVLFVIGYTSDEDDYMLSQLLVSCCCEMTNSKESLKNLKGLYKTVKLQYTCIWL